MGIIKRILTAWHRHHRSRGFGIHSPFAYRFVRGVLRERLPYYSYDAINALHGAIKQMPGSRRTRLMSKHEARLLFRITNHFNPAHIVQVGAATGYDSAVMLAVSSRSRITLCGASEVAMQVLAPLRERCTLCDSLDQILATTNDKVPFVLINSLPTACDYDTLSEWLQHILSSQAVVIVRNLHHDKTMKKLWHQARLTMPMGQTYCNGKTAILNATPRLQREDFVLWL